MINMYSHYRAIISKWVPQPSVNLGKRFANSLIFIKKMDEITFRIITLLKNNFPVEDYFQHIENLVQYTERVIIECKLIINLLTTPNFIFKYKIKYLRFILRRNINIGAAYIKYLINEVFNCINDEYLIIIFRLINIYNELLSLDQDESKLFLNIFYNDWPGIFESLKKFSITCLLKILAHKKTEEYCYQLINYLLANYRSSCNKNDTFTTFNDMDILKNSSIDIYRTLIKYLNYPTINKTVVYKVTVNVESMQTLVNNQNELIFRTLKLVKLISLDLFNADDIKIINDKRKIRKATIKKITSSYQELVWCSVSNILDHIILWWTPEALSLQHTYGSQHLKNWLQLLIQGNNVPSGIRLALQTLFDSLGCHVTITIWDQFFRYAYTAAFNCKSQASTEVSKGTETGQKFFNIFENLMALINEREISKEWIVGTPLIELPLSENIIALHRMDHSIHMMRLWTMVESRIIAHSWELKIFFLLVNDDIVNSIRVLSFLKLSGHTNELEHEEKSVQVFVCTKMRTKIISEIKTNIQLLKNAPILCIKMLEKNCRIISLTCLHMYFPKSIYWNYSAIKSSIIPSFYVNIYFERILLPVLKVIEDSEISNMILQIMCESWLDYIYKHNIKFSKSGALQLLSDFAYVLTWISTCSIISKKTRQHLLKSEVLRKCEGVGSLLLRHTGEAISMNKIFYKKNIKNGSFESLGLERMPAEMYVPNQEQWLKFQVKKQCSFCFL